VPPERVGPPVAFDAWWLPKVPQDAEGNPFSRKNFVRALANPDGGAHVDPELNAAYAALTKNNSLGREGTDDQA
jgi:hypothetical protein